MRFRLNLIFVEFFYKIIINGVESVVAVHIIALFLSYNVIPASAGVRQGDLWRLALPTKGGDFMSIDYIMLLLALSGQVNVSSITVTKSSVTIRIKK